jgi:hypothetical protein
VRYLVIAVLLVLFLLTATDGHLAHRRYRDLMRRDGKRIQELQEQLNHRQAPNPQFDWRKQVVLA